MTSDLKIREAQSGDIVNLYNLVNLSTNYRTQLTEESLSGCLFGFEFEVENLRKVKETGIIFDPQLVKSNSNTCRAILADIGTELIGYIIFHFHYSPWLGHSTYVDDIFVKECEGNKDLAKSLIDHAEILSIELGIGRILFNQSIPGSRYLMEDKNVKALRNNKTDWGVRRIVLEP